MSTSSEPPREHRERALPETLRLRSIAPSLTVNDIQESLAWYRDVVGFTVTEEWMHEGELRGVSLVAGSALLLLSQDDGERGWDRGKGEGFRLYLNTAQDIDRIAEDITARGGTLDSQPADMPWGGRAFALTDPSGFRLTIASVD